MDNKKGKSVTTSVPSISIKFNANNEELEDFYADDESTEECVKECTPVSEKTHSKTQASDPESSPLRSYLPRLGKRSTSIDVSLSTGSTSLGHDASPPSDPWRFFTDIKGKITKSVEGKLTEYKSKTIEEESPKSSKPVKDSKENSSLSDSEELSESSISRTCGIISTTEGVEMSSDDETQSLSEKEKSAQTSDSGNNNAEEKVIKVRSGQTEAEVSEKHLKKIATLVSDNPTIAADENDENDEEIENATDALEDRDLVTELAEIVENINVGEDGVIVHEHFTGESARETFMQSSSSRAVFAPTGFVDMRRPTYIQHTGWRYYFTSFRRVVPVVVLLSAYFCVQLPIYVSGFIAGSLVMLTLCLLYYIFKLKGILAENIEIREKGRVFEIPPVKEYAPITKFEGWMNEYPEKYNPHTYHVSQTQTVYFKLQGSLLKVSHTKAKIPKRATWNEAEHRVQLTHHRIYNLLGASIKILPEGLARKRRWSKKYPICIVLSPDQLICEESEPENLSISTKGSLKSKNSRSKRSKSNKSEASAVTFSSQTECDQLSTEGIELDDLSGIHGAVENSTNEMPAKDSAIHLSPTASEFMSSDMLSISSDTSNNASYTTLDSADMMRLMDNNVVDIEKSEVYLKDDLDQDWISYMEETEHLTRLYFFGRTDREKEDWFRRLAQATHKGAFEDKFAKEDESKTRKANKKHEKLHTEVYAELQKGVSGDMFWINAIMGRILFDCMRDPDFTEKVKNRVQRKLSAIKLPYFIEELALTELSLGETPPLVHRAGAPIIDERGLWVDLDLTYEGLIVLTIHTKINLLKLKEPPNAAKVEEKKNMAMFNSDMDDTAESSTDEDTAKFENAPVLDAAGMPIHGLGGTSNASKKFIRIVDKIADSKFFKAASEYKYIKRAMEGVSNTDLGLKVEVKALAGTLVLNVPPPPSDRVWMSFRPTPKLMLTANPIVGERNITYLHVTSWIEQKLIQEFHKVLVIPNMEDLYISIMCPRLPK